jgi:site-specific DNA-methyltransferase (adenine-specific)
LDADRAVLERRIAQFRKGKRRETQTNTKGPMTIQLTTPRVMPRQKPGRSQQDCATPDDLIHAVELRFGKIAFDLAALRETSRGADYFGPDHHDPTKRDALTNDWPRKGLNWLNPPYGDISTWAQKCCQQQAAGVDKILFLVPSSTGANWFQDLVFDKAQVLWLRGRLTFKGHDTPYPKDCILAYYHPGVSGNACWDWKGAPGRLKLKLF